MENKETFVLEETLKNMSKEEILARLTTDEDYYGAFGQQFLSNSDIGALIKDPSKFHKEGEPSFALLFGGAFHTMILEPHKMDQYPIIDATTRGTKKYKEESGGEMTLLTKDLLKLKEMRESLEKEPDIMSLIEQGEKEVPAFMEICGEMWKGKADVLNHDAKMIIDLKTTGNLDQFASSAKKWNYDSQAFIYNHLFGYDVAFVAIDKNTKRVGFFDCSQEFLKGGREKVIEAVYNYRLWFKDQNVDEVDTSFLLHGTL